MGYLGAINTYCSVLAVIVPVQSQNLAFNKKAWQSSTYTDPRKNYSANLAVNDDAWGDGDYSHTNEGINQWWRVDLGNTYNISRIELVNREFYFFRLSKISILTTTEENPSDPVLSDDKRSNRGFQTPWIEQSYQEKPYGAVGVVSLQDVSVRHLAVFNSGNHGITLREVYVHQSVCSNLALNKPSNQSSTEGVRPASFANDGVMDKFSLTEEKKGYEWWRVDLGSNYHVYKTIMFGRNDCCPEVRYAGLSVLTSEASFEPDPSVTKTGEMRKFSGRWVEQYYQKSEAKAKSEQIFPAVSARHLAIFNSYTMWGVALKEFQVFACECVLNDVVSTPIIQKSGKTGCVSVSWKWSHSQCIQSLFRLEYRCNASEKWSTSRAAGVDEVCHYPLVMCLFRACIGSSCAYKMDSANTTCAGPSVPTHYNVQESFLSSRDVMAEISWKVSDPGCSRVMYIVSVNNSMVTDMEVAAPSIRTTLKPCTGYRVTVSAVNNAQFSSSSYKDFITLKTAPIPVVIINSTALNTTCMEITWRDDNSLLYCKTITYHVNCTKRPGFRTDLLKAKICELEPGSDAICSVAADNGLKSSPVDSPAVNMPCKAPDSIGNLKVDVKNSTCLLLSWRGPVTSNLCGIREYYINCSEKSRISTSYSQSLICGLEPGSNLSCSVAAHNGLISEYKQTPAISIPCPAPEPIMIINTTALSTSCLEIRWRDDNSFKFCRAINYHVKCSEKEKLITSDTQSQICGLEPGSEVSCSVAAYNGLMSSNVTSVNISMPCEEPAALKMKNSTSLKSSCLLLSFQIPSMSSLCRLEALTGWCSDTSRSSYQVPLNHSIYNQSIEICGFRASAEVLCQLKTVNVKKNRSKTFSITGYIQPTELSKADESKSWNIPVSVSVPIGVIIIAAIAIALVFYNRNRKRPNKPQTIYEEPCQMSDIQPASVAEENNENHEAKDFSLYENLGEVITTKQTALKVKDLESFIDEKSSDITSQFKDLESVKVGQMSAASKPENNGKNKYKNLYPADEWRVVLDKTRTQDGSDYINASFLKGFKKDNHYIAAQGPTQRTINDFWLMIWQTEPSALVMVTNVFEDGKSKCEQYWPEKDGLREFHSISVRCLLEEDWADFVLRTMQLTKDNKTLTIKQFHFTSWPDQGVPRETTPFISFCRFIQSHIKGSPKPLLVHCSAGVGRTGTFIALDYLREEGKATGAVDPFSCVKSMRERRPAMIQNEEQYFFLYEVLLESLLAEKYVTSSNKLQEKLERHRKTSKSSSPITSEFLRILKLIKSKTFMFAEGKVTVNRKKNRFRDILPNDLHRPFVSPRGEPGAYINAVCVDGYRSKDYIICTQLPLTNSIADFWKLVLFWKSCVVVQLDEGEPVFYPRMSGEAYEADDVAVTCESIDHTDSLITYRLSVQFSHLESSVMLMHFKTPEFGLPTCASTIGLLEHVEQNVKKTGSECVVITCLDGAKKCGLICCAMNALQKLKAEQEVDLYHTVLAARSRRPEFVSVQEEYVWLYAVLSEYVNSFMEYSNFK